MNTTETAPAASQLKYEHIQPGTKIRAYDFQPMKGRPDDYFDGIVIEHREVRGVKLLVVRCEKEGSARRIELETSRREGQEIFVPMEMFGEWEDFERVQILNESLHIDATSMCRNITITISDVDADTAAVQLQNGDVNALLVMVPATIDSIKEAIKDMVDDL